MEKLKKITIVLMFLVGIIVIGIESSLAEEDVACFHCHTKIVDEFKNNVHYGKGFTCEDCHGGTTKANNTLSINVMSGDFIGRPERENITGMCSKCHPGETIDYKQSIHWEEIKKGHPEAATCTDCHGVHEIRAIKDDKSSSNHQNSPETCAKCHANKELMSAWYYGVKDDRMDTYKESFHWKALNNGYSIVAACADCHGNHITKSHLDPTSSVYPDNLPKTCGKKNCHPQARFDPKIAAGLVHDKESLHSGELKFNKTGMNSQIRSYYLGPFDLAYWIAIFFKILTTLVIGFFTGMVVLDLLSRFRLKKRWQQ